VLVVVVVIYAVLFMNWDTKDTPFDGVSCFFSSGCCVVSWTNGLANRSEKPSSLVSRLYSPVPRLLVR
jgi:hypothetical protein